MITIRILLKSWARRGWVSDRFHLAGLRKLILSLSELLTPAGSVVEAAVLRATAA
jgi:hypothetical protein